MTNPPSSASGSHSETAATADGSQNQVPWWRRAITYQVYIRSFADSNGDGTGDVNGLRSKLPYLRDLGVDAIWINPWYASPLADGGYDVADYRNIAEQYGTLADAEALISEAHDHGIKVIVDVVPNHTSEQHAWFVEAKSSPPGHPSRNRYHIRPGQGADSEQPPTNWTSVFGGPAWTRLPDGEWYLHLFAPEQPDMNWEHPEVRQEFLDVLTFWLDRGADGFRVDVAHGIVKDMTFPDMAETTEVLVSNTYDNHPHWDRDGIHEIIRTWRSLLNTYDGDRMMVAEAWVRPERLPLYLRPDEYHQSFNFDLLEAEWSAGVFSTIIDKAVAAAADVGSTPTWVLSNHDVMREATRYGLPAGTDWRRWPATGPAEDLNVGLGQRRARAAALVVLGLPGSTYVYQGEELGLPEAWDLPEEVLDDPVWERSNHTQKGRDGCRVPIPWAKDGPSLGFGDGDPWLPQPAGWSGFSAEAQAGQPDSTLELYRRAIALRRTLGAADEDLELLDPTQHGLNEAESAEVLMYRRGSGLTCMVNFGSAPVTVPASTETELVRSGGIAGTPLDPDTAVWFTA